MIEKEESTRLLRDSDDREMPHDADIRHREWNSLCWKNISVRGKRKGKPSLWRRTSYVTFQIVEKTSGLLPGGSLLAIMGPSGSGKTTLLTAISRRLTEEVRGNVYVNGQIMTADQMLSLSSFAAQNDLMLPSLTVDEHFKIMARLKLDRDTTDIHRTKKISTLMRVVGIENLASSNISDLSGGEKKRLSIAVQLLSDPPLLFCDEPTTGLDSANAVAVIRMLKIFSSQGKTVICTIHQPAAVVYELFDQVLLLASGGRTIYFGPVSKASGYFEKLGFACPQNYNIAMFLIDNVSVTDSGAGNRIELLRQHYSTCTMKCELEERILKHISDTSNEYLIMGSISAYFNTRKPTLLTQSSTLVLRSFLNLRKNYTKLITAMATLIFVSTIVTVIFGEVTLCSANSIQNIRGSLSMYVRIITIERALYHINSVLSEKKFVMREINNGLYCTEAYCISRFIARMAISVSESMIVVLILKAGSQAYDHLSLWTLALPFIVSYIATTAYGGMFASVFDDLELLKIVDGTYHFISFALSGTFINLNSLPKILGYLRYLCPMYYFLEYLLVLEWSEALRLNIQCANNTSNEEGPAAALNLLASIGYDVQHYQKNIWILIFMSTTFYALAYAFLCKKSKEPVVY